MPTTAKVLLRQTASVTRNNYFCFLVAAWWSVLTAGVRLVGTHGTRGVSLPEQRGNLFSGKGTALLVLGGTNQCTRQDKKQECVYVVWTEWVKVCVLGGGGVCFFFVLSLAAFSGCCLKSCGSSYLGAQTAASDTELGITIGNNNKMKAGERTHTHVSKNQSFWLLLTLRRCHRLLSLSLAFCQWQRWLWTLFETWNRGALKNHVKPENP